MGPNKIQSGLVTIIVIGYVMIFFSKLGIGGVSQTADVFLLFNYSQNVLFGGVLTLVLAAIYVFFLIVKSKNNSENGSENN